MKRMVCGVLAFAITGLLLGAKQSAEVSSAEVSAPSSVPQRTPPDAASGLSILSYNVQGLPWPLARGREDAAAEIAERLARVRSLGAQPHIVVVQEAFSPWAKDIGRDAGYRYVAFGPDGDGPAAATNEDRRFASSGQFWKGELIGKYADSGLAIFSDYPILWTRRIPFPGFACAGYDCLAGKGVLVVALKIPRSERPLVVINTHLNSGKASGVSDARSLFAYQRQVDTLGPIVTEALQTGDVVVAGDFNVGAAEARSDYLQHRLLGADRFAFAAREQSRSHQRRELGGLAPLSAASLMRTKTLIVFSRQMQPTGEPEAFGQSGDGTMLSDHIGVSQRFLVSQQKM